MKFLQFLVSKTFLKSLVIAVVAIVAMVFITFQLLKLYTHHGEYILVPDLQSLTEKQANTVLASKNMRMDVSDSVYSKRHAPGTVVEQMPKAGAKVKENRKIFVIMNAKSPEMVLMPDLSDVSLRQARNILQAAGLEMGDVIYVNSPYTNVVINQYFENIPIEPGAKITKGSVVDLEVGKGLSNELGNIPLLSGMTIEEARQALLQAGMNLGVIVEDFTSKDNRDSAFIWKQRPDTAMQQVRKGTAFDVWLTMDSTLLYPDTLAIDTLVSETIIE